MATEVMKFMIEDARLIFRNFSGEESQYNKAGERNFCIVLDEDTAEKMASDGWNVKRLRPREDEDEPVGTPYIQVKVNFKNKPPKIVVITSTGRTTISEETVGTLDWVEILTVDLIARAYEWEVGDKSGIKAYLQSMYITVEEDDLERKYAQMD